MTLFLPVFYLIFGIIFGRFSWDLKPLLSLFLTKFIIPVMIIYNVSTKFSIMGLVLISTVIVMSLMLIVGRVLKVNPVDNICFSYLNIGWPGLPVASSLFGNEAATIVISAYIGSSVIGNSVGACMLSGVNFSIRKILIMPPVIALLTGFALLPVAGKITANFSFVYDAAKFPMSFLGMAVLGMWLSKARISLADIASNLIHFLKRSLLYFIIMTFLILLACFSNQRMITENIETLYLFCLLPPAANIIVLETYYLGTGFSVKSISCGTCISIIAISIYALVILSLRQIS